MNVIIPTAGLGTRLRPHTHTRPKPLVPVAGKAVIGHLLDKLKVLPLDDVVFITGYLGTQIEEYVRKNYNFKSHFVEQTELKGQAHAIALAREMVSGPTLILFVDTIFEANLNVLNQTDADGVIYVSEVEDPSRFGVALLEDGIITKLVEKPSTPVSNLALIGAYYVREVKELFAAIDVLIEQNIQTKGEFYLADALQLMISNGTRFSAETATMWEDCGTAPALLRTNRYLLQHETGNVEQRDGAIIVPPVFIGENVEIRNSIIGPYVSVADHSVIVDSIVRDSIINQGASIQSSTLEGSLIGEGAHIKGEFQHLNVGDSSVITFGSTIQ
ncbi:MAG TPA: nucleotidyltransferase [Herpetosiphon sp.]|uniref:Nucleotidyl transferase n=2 Tax=Herpetosiphon TaxID=64 RepID=A9B1I4_HERA2|nr:sugar phosphate nucleotidyltransferase [Herpetosiphon sp.]ABX03869.1 Nucleotidyl transferase [Herpetosiphon aurantiacus DSM 785]HBW50315.1 nucleotidyltransferase [Herpetosiphon sp.]